MNGLGGDDAIIATRNLCGINCGIQASGEVGSTGKSQAVGADGVHMILPNVVDPDFHLASTGEVCSEKASHSAAAHDAYSDQCFPFLTRYDGAGFLSGKEAPGHVSQTLAAFFTDAVSVLRI